MSDMLKKISHTTPDFTTEPAKQLAELFRRRLRTKKSIHWDTIQNVFIEVDNLEVLNLQNLVFASLCSSTAWSWNRLISSSLSASL